jgi:hypothetical protein
MDIIRVAKRLYELFGIERKPHVETKILELLETLPGDDVESYLDFLQRKSSGKRSPSGWVVSVLSSPAIIQEYQGKQRQDEPEAPELCPVCGKYFYGLWCRTCGHEIGDTLETIEMRKKEFALEKRNPEKYRQWVKEKRDQFLHKYTAAARALHDQAG